MRTDLRITGPEWDALRSHLLAADGDEHAAVLICGTLETTDLSALLVHEVVPLHGDDFLASGALQLSISPIAIARIAKRARSMSATLVLAHSHPFPGQVAASALDLATEAELCGRVLAQRLEPLKVGALVIGPEGFDGRLWSAEGFVPLDRITVVDKRLTWLPERTAQVSERVDRQARAWGAAGQTCLSDAHIAVVGCGGTGSHVAVQLAHLGVGRLTLVDADTVETTNLSRIVGSRADDVGSAKVDVLARGAAAVNSGVRVSGLQRSVLDVDPRVLGEADILVCCTDGHGSRALLTELGQQYLVPLIDLGVEIVPTQGGLSAGGGVRILLPGRGCLQCAGTLNAELVRREYLSDEDRAAEQERGYIRDLAEPAPSVIALNGVVASLAVLEVCHLLTGMLGNASPRLLYRATERRLTTAAIVRQTGCYVCGGRLLGRGDSAATPTRWRNPGDTAA